MYLTTTCALSSLYLAAKLFSSNCGYSGFGWDEFHNEEVGVRRRLLDALRKCCMYPKEMDTEAEERFREGESASRARENIWEKLIESGAEFFDSAFDSHDNSMKELQHRLEDARVEFISGIEKILASLGSGRLIMATEDKFERLELKNANSLGLSAFCIQRQGDAFRGRDKRGALPSNATKDNWVEMMKLPTRLLNLKSNARQRDRTVDSSKSSSKAGSSKRKRMVIMDSDEDDDEGSIRNDKDPSNCLKVTVKKTQQKETTSSSIHSIKKQLGVNVDELERGREDIEAEENMTKEAAYVDEVGELFQSLRNHGNTIAYSEEIAELNESILDEEENVHMLKSVCKRKNRGDDEVRDIGVSCHCSRVPITSQIFDCYI